MVLLGEAFYCSGESLDLSFEGGGEWFISLNIVGGCHGVSKHHATLGLGSNSMAFYLFLISHRQRQLMMPKIVSKSHNPHVLKTIPTQHKTRRPSESTNVILEIGRAHV